MSSRSSPGARVASVLALFAVAPFAADALAPAPADPGVPVTLVSDGDDDGYRQRYEDRRTDRRDDRRTGRRTARRYSVMRLG